MPFQVDPRSATPIYDQISTQVKHAVAAGTLGNGDSLPSVRKLAIALRVNPNTVARAYRELEAEAVVVTRRGQGTFVASGAKKLSAGARRRALGPGLERLVADAHALGLREEEVVEQLREVWGRLSAGRSARKTERTQ